MAAGSTYTPIATTTLGSAVTSYTFSSIPSTYTDLVLVTNFGADTATYARCRINGDTGSNYSETSVGGNGSLAQSFRDSNVSNGAYITYNGYAGTNAGSAMYILNLNNYSNTTTYKTILTREAAAASSAGATVSLWRSTAAINSIMLYMNSGNFASGSTFTLYGIAAA